MEINLADIPHAFHLPRVDWNVVGTWIEKHCSKEQRAEVWKDLAMQWLDSLDQALGQRYRLILSDNLMLFAPDAYQQSHALIDFAEAGLTEIISQLGELARETWQGPLAILLFEDVETYCRYVTPFDPDGEFFRSGGACLRDGYTHIALRPYPYESLQTTLLHEVSHGCLSHLGLPLWLEEGITQLAEEATVPSHTRFRLSNEDATRLRAYWREHGLGDFWWGAGFFLSGETQHFSYQLAQVLFRLIVSDHRKLLPEFVRRAAEADAGDSAARDVLGRSVGDIASQFLGKGTWAPEPIDCHGYVRRGNFYLSRKQYELALADLDRAIELDDKSPEAFGNRGDVHWNLGNITAAMADCERTIELNPKDPYAHNTLAWILATSPDDNLRDGKRAVKLATQACDLDGFSSWFCVGTLAAAYAEVGDFEEALQWARESLDLAPEEEQADCKELLSFYKAGKPFRETSRSGAHHTHELK